MWIYSLNMLCHVVLLRSPLPENKRNIKMLNLLEAKSFPYLLQSQSRYSQKIKKEITVILFDSD